MSVKFQNIPLDVVYHVAPHMAPSDLHALRCTCKEYSQLGKIAPQGAMTVDQLRELIQQTPYIATVDFSKCADSITDDHLALLAPYAHQIKVLNLAHCAKVTYRGFKVFEHSPLVDLSLSHLSFSTLFTTVDMKGILFLDIEKLKRLDLSHCDLWIGELSRRNTVLGSLPLPFKNFYATRINMEGAHSRGSSIPPALLFGKNPSHLSQ